MLLVTTSVITCMSSVTKNYILKNNIINIMRSTKTNKKVKMLVCSKILNHIKNIIFGYKMWKVSRKLFHHFLATTLEMLLSKLELSNVVWQQNLDCAEGKDSCSYFNFEMASLTLIAIIATNKKMFWNNKWKSVNIKKRIR